MATAAMHKLAEAATYNGCSPHLAAEREIQRLQ